MTVSHWTLSPVHQSDNFAQVHSRFSTNSFPSWNRAHPFRRIAHNGPLVGEQTGGRFDKGVTSLWSLWTSRSPSSLLLVRYSSTSKMDRPKHRNFWITKVYRMYILYLHISEKSVGIAEYLTKRLLGSENFMICFSYPPSSWNENRVNFNIPSDSARWDQYLGGQSQLHSYQRSLDDQQQGLWWCSTGGTPNANYQQRNKESDGPFQQLVDVFLMEWNPIFLDSFLWCWGIVLWIPDRLSQYGIGF